MADGSLLVTNAGLAAVVAANKSGTNKVTINKAGLGTGKYTPAGNRTAMYAKFKDLSTIAGGGIDANTIHVEIRDESTDSYTVYELGLFLSDGTLFAIASSTEPFMQKASGSVGIIACDIRLADVSVENITFGATNFSVPQATETTAGVAEIATLEEAAAGTDHSRIVTPKALKQETGKCVHLSGNETVAGVKTFSSSPKGKTPAAAENSTVIPTTEWVKSLIATTLLAAHPVGSYYITEGTEDPATLFGGTWSKVKNRMLIGAGDSFAVSAEGGASSVTLAVGNIPAHTHTASTASSGGHTHTATTSWNGDHNHNRGNMEISGQVHAHNHASIAQSACNGAFAWDDGNGRNIDTGGWNGQGGGFNFYASRSWTGTTNTTGGHNHTLTTTSNGAHTHTVTVGSTGSGNAFSILNPYRAVYMWRRTA